MMDVIFKDNNIFYNVLCFLIAENEKLFDKNDARLYWKSVLHILSLLHHTYIGTFAISLDLSGHSESEIRTLKKFRGAYLTGWSFLFQATYLSLSVIHDFLEWFDNHDGQFGKKVRYWRDVVFSGLVVPTTTFVTTMFWTVYLIDRDLVYPKLYDDIVPWWFNHCVHTNVFVVVVLEILLEPRRRPRDFKLETIFYAAATILYAVVYYSIYFFAGRWLYKVFALMTWWQVCLFQMLIFLSTHVYYRIQFPIGRLIHGPESESSETIEEIINTEKSKVNTEEKVVPYGGNDDKGPNGTDKQPDVVIKNDKINDNSQFNGASFTDKSWNLKYRNVRNQFENGNV